MKTNEEIIGKIKEVIYEEHKNIVRLRNLKKECENNGALEASRDLENYEKNHVRACEMLASVLVYALDD